MYANCMGGDGSTCNLQRFQLSCSCTTASSHIQVLKRRVEKIVPKLRRDCSWESLRAVALHVCVAPRGTRPCPRAGLRSPKRVIIRNAKPRRSENIAALWIVLSDQVRAEHSSAESKVPTAQSPNAARNNPKHWRKALQHSVYNSYDNRFAHAVVWGF